MEMSLTMPLLADQKPQQTPNQALLEQLQRKQAEQGLELARKIAEGQRHWTTPLKKAA